MHTRLPVLLMFLALLLPASALAQPHPEGVRQLTLAMAELEEESFEAALHSAASAIRLDPRLNEAVFLKARAYEGLRKYSLAEAALVVYMDQTPPLRQEPETGDMLARLREKTQGKKKRSKQDLKASDYLKSVLEKLRAEDCAEAAVVAQEFTLREPLDPTAWRLVGDAAHCAEQKMQEARAYRRAIEFGSKDRRVRERLEALEPEFGSIVVELFGDLRGTEPRVELLIGGGRFVSRVKSAVHEFRDLPPGVQATIEVHGKGVVRSRQVQEIPMGGKETRLEIPMETAGPGTLTFEPWTETDFSVEYFDEDGMFARAAPGDAVELTAGPVTCRVLGKQGHRDVEVQVAEGSNTKFRPWLDWPTALRVSGLPVGATVTLTFKEGQHEQVEGVWITKAVDGGRKGDPMAAPHEFRSLKGGWVVLDVKHPEYGAGQMRISLTPGVLNEATFDMTTLPRRPVTIVK